MPSVPASPGRHRAVAWSSKAVTAWMRRRIADSGGDPADIPDEPTAFWRLPTVIERTGLSRPTIYRLAALGQFPRGVPLSAP
ncbi:MAG TPA: AlpA family phage regulatory protein [Steroidobacteraceae bacterium]|nr:AlpA family phage regulatory protein [Steroidobacteraceae bacterium]